MVRRDDVPWAEVQKLNAQGWSYRQLAEKFGVSSSAIGRRAVQECWHGTDAQRANARLRNLAAGLRRQAEQRALPWPGTPPDWPAPPCSSRPPRRFGDGIWPPAFAARQSSGWPVSWTPGRSRS